MSAAKIWPVSGDKGESPLAEEDEAEGSIGEEEEKKREAVGGK